MGQPVSTQHPLMVKVMGTRGQTPGPCCFPMNRLVLHAGPRIRTVPGVILADQGKASEVFGVYFGLPSDLLTFSLLPLHTQIGPIWVRWRGGDTGKSPSKMNLVVQSSSLGNRCHVSSDVLCERSYMSGISLIHAC